MNLTKRYRRLRRSSAIRELVAETHLTPALLITPIFVIEGKDKKEPIASMPGYYRLSLDQLNSEIPELNRLGLNSVLVFAKAADHLKDNEGKEAFNPDGLMQRAVREIKRISEGTLVMTDVALDPYSIHGHDGIVEGTEIVNDKTVEVLARMAVSQ